MKNHIILKENELISLIKRIIKENNDTEMMNCIAKAYGLGLSDIIKLLPCQKCQEDPSPENMEDCANAVRGVVEKKGYDIFKIAQMTLSAGKCLTGSKSDGGFGFPGIGGGSY
jgi:hypothetical protein